MLECLYVLEKYKWTALKIYVIEKFQTEKI